MSTFTTPLYPGVNPDDNYGPQLNTVCVAFICISFVALVLRYASRKMSKIPPGLDDWLGVLAGVLSWVYTAGVINEVLYNYYGQHIGKSDAAHLQSWFKGLFAIAILYPIALTASKLSLLALLYRIFGINKARIPMLVAAGLNIAWMIAAVLVGIFSCNPVSGFWNLETPSTCIEEYDFFLSNEVITITLDLIVLMTPIYFVSQIKRSLSQRISIASTFGLGLIATIVSAIRLWQLVIAQQRPGFDPTFNETGAALWAVIELNVWVVVACIPALRPLVTRAYVQIGSSGFMSGSFSLKPWSSVRPGKSTDTRSSNAVTLPIQRHPSLPAGMLGREGSSYSGSTPILHGTTTVYTHDQPPVPTRGAAETSDALELGRVPGQGAENEFARDRPERAYVG